MSTGWKTLRSASRRFNSTSAAGLDEAVACTSRVWPSQSRNRVRASTLPFARGMKVISPYPPTGMRGLLMGAALMPLLQPRRDVAGREPQVLAELEGPRRPAGQPPVIDGLHGDTEVLGELLDPDRGAPAPDL
ncbi:MAG: hypothetical protein V9G13_04615 [Marmoricola sp.]